MGTYKLSRFAHADGLKAISPENLLALLSSYDEFFQGRGVILPSSSDVDDLDYEKLAGILISPDTDTPQSLADALYFIHEMATTDGMDDILEAIEGKDIHLNGNPDPTPADVAVQVYLQDKELLERKHAENLLTHPRSFMYFQTDRTPVPAFKTPDAKVLEGLKADLDNWFESKKRGRNSKIFVYPKEDGIWFLIRHGEPYRREGSIESGKSSSVLYRPEKHDVLVYDPDLGEIRMNAKTKGERELYRKKLGFHVFGDKDFFPGKGKYTLEPLRDDGEDALVCTDIDGLEWVKLKEIQYAWGGAEKEIEVRKADDIFAALKARDRSIPKSPRIISASFKVKFVDSKTPRTLSIRPSNIAQYTRDDDSVIIEDWLNKRGFTGEKEDDE